MERKCLGGGAQRAWWRLCLPRTQTRASGLTGHPEAKVPEGTKRSYRDYNILNLRFTLSLTKSLLCPEVTLMLTAIFEVWCMFLSMMS